MELLKFFDRYMGKLFPHFVMTCENDMEIKCEYFFVSVNHNLIIFVDFFVTSMFINFPL